MPSRNRAHRLVVAALVTGLLALVAAPGVRAEEPAGPAGDVVQLVRVSTPTWEARDLLTSLGLDLTEHGGDDFVEVVLHGADDVATLADAGLTWDVEIADLAAHEAMNRRADAAYAAATVASPLPSGRDSYRTLEDYEAELDALAAEHPDLVKPLTLAHPSVEGREVRGIEITTNPTAIEDGKPVFVMLGLHHAREWPSGEMAMEFAHDLVQGHGTDPEIADLVNRVRTIIVPVVNVDGFDVSRTAAATFDGREVADEGNVYSAFTLTTEAYRRRNCRMMDGQDTPPGACGAPGTRALGVDLNRNYGALWGGGGASALPVEDTYRGPAPFSEPETQNVRELVSSRQVVGLITNHTFSRLVLRPPGVRAQGMTPDEPLLEELGARMAAHNGYTNQPAWALYDTTGSTEDWTYGATGGLGYTFEIGDEFHPPFEEVVDEYLGTGERDGLNVRGAYFEALAAAADEANHAVLRGRVSGERVLRLTKSFTTHTSPVRPAETLLVEDPTGEAGAGEPIAFEDRLESVLRTGRDGRFTWHVNQSTRPAVMERRLQVLEEEPSREEVHEASGPIANGEHEDVTFTLTEADAAVLRVNLDWATPDDYDLELYRQEGGELVEVATSGGLPGEKEEILVDDPVAGEYVARVVNFAAANPQWTLTFGVYEAGEEVLQEGTTEAWVLTCETTDGRVLARRGVVVDRGERLRVDLRGC